MKGALPSFFSEGHHVYALSRSFSLQYTSLILLILACVVGAFSKPHEELAAAAPPPVTQVPEGKHVPPGRVSEDLVFFDFFLPWSQSLNVERAQILAQVLKNHDLVAEIQVGLLNGERESTTDRDFNLSLARSISLYQYYLSEGIPPEALRISASDTFSNEQVRVVFYPEEAS